MTHAALAVGARAVTRFRRRPRALGLVAVMLAMLPDLDVLAFRVGVPAGSMWSHRGITHSLPAALAVGSLTALVIAPRGASRARLALFCSLVMASHGVLDAMTDGALGVAFFAPFDARRYLFPFRFLPVSPIGLRFFSARGLRVFEAEVALVWIPTAVVVGLIAGWRRLASGRRQPA